MSSVQLHFLNPAGLFDAAVHGYSHLAIGPAASQLICVAGQSGHDAKGALSPHFEDQAAQALANVEIALAAASARLSDVARTTVLVVDHDAAKLEALVRLVKVRWPDDRPPLTLIPVPRLALDGMLIEIEVTALLPSDTDGKLSA